MFYNCYSQNWIMGKNEWKMKNVKRWSDNYNGRTVRANIK